MAKLINLIKNQQDARHYAIEWQAWQAHQSLSYAEINTYQKFFYDIGRKYKVLREFQENGIV